MTRTNTLLSISVDTHRRLRLFAEKLDNHEASYDQIVNWGLDELEIAWAQGIDAKYREAVEDAADGEIGNTPTEPVTEDKPDVR